MSNKVDVIERLAVELSLEADNFKNKMTSINALIRNSEKDFKSAGKGVNNFENTFVGLDAKIQKTTKQLELHSLKLKNQKEEYEKNAKEVNNQKEKLEELEKTLGKSSKEWKDQAELVSKNSRVLGNLGADIRKTESEINNLEGELKKSKTAFDNLGSTTKTMSEMLEDVENEASLTKSEFNKLGSELKESGNYFKKLGNEMNTLAAQIDAGTKKVMLYENSIDDLSKELTKSKEMHDSLGKEIKSTEEELNKAKVTYGENSDEAIKLKNDLLQLKDKYVDLEKEIEDNSKELKGYKTDLNNTQTEVNQLAKELKSLPFDKVGNDLKELGSKTKDIGRGLTTGVTVPIAGAGVAAGVAGTNFDTAMSKLQATADISDKSSESFQKLEAKAKDMGASTSFSAKEAAEGLTYLSLAGWDVETSIDRIEPVLRAAEAGGMDLALTADLVTDSMSAAGVESKDFAKYLDIAAQAQRKSNQSMQQLFEANIVAGGSFKMLKIPMTESNALLGILANRGIKGSEAGKALSSTFANLVTETGQAGEALEAMNISLFDSNGKQRDMISVLKELRGKLINTADGTSLLTEEQQAQYAAMIGGKTQFDTLMALLDGLGSEYDNLVVDLDNSSGALNEMAKIMKDNLGGEIETMKSAIEGSLIEAFVALEPVISKVVELITDAANWFSGLDDEQQKTIITMAALIACIGPLLMGIGQIIIIGGNAVTLFGSLAGGGTAAAGATGGLTSAVGILSGPVGIGLLIAALVAVIAMIGDSEGAILSLQEKFGGLGFIIGGVCEFISGTVQLTLGNVCIAIMGVCDVIAAILDGPGGLTVSEAWGGMTAKLTVNTEEAMSKISLTTTRGMSQMLHATEESLVKLTTVMDTTLGTVPGIVEGNYTDASRVLAEQLNGMSSEQLTILKGMNDTTKIMFQGINDRMTVDEAANQVEVNLNQMSKAGKINGDTMSKDISSAMDTLNKQLQSKTKDASTEVTKNMNEIEKDTTSSAKSMERNASNSADNMKNNVTNSTDKMARESISDWNRMRSSFSNPINGKVNITQSTYQRTYKESSQQYSIPGNNEMGRLFKNTDISQYEIQGGYYNSSSRSSREVGTIDRNLSIDIKKIIEGIVTSKTSKEKQDIKIYLSIENFNGNNEEELKSLVNKMAEMLNIKLGEIKESKNKRLGGVKLGH